MKRLLHLRSVNEAIKRAPEILQGPKLGPWLFINFLRQTTEINTF